MVLGRLGSSPHKWSRMPLPGCSRVVKPLRAQGSSAAAAQLRVLVCRRGMGSGGGGGLFQGSPPTSGSIKPGWPMWKLNFLGIRANVREVLQWLLRSHIWRLLERGFLASQAAGSTAHSMDSTGEVHAGKLLTAGAALVAAKITTEASPLSGITATISLPPPRKPPPSSRLLLHEKPPPAPWLVGLSNQKGAQK